MAEVEIPRCLAISFQLKLVNNVPKFKLYWGFPVVGWPYLGWPYYPPVATEAPPAYSEPAQQPPYYWYYCQDPQGYYPYVKSCPSGWIQVKPKVTPPTP